MDITLHDGTDVELREVWNCCEGTSDCGSAVDVYDKDSSELIAELPGIALPDEDDEDFDLEEYVSVVSGLVDEYAIM